MTSHKYLMSKKYSKFNLDTTSEWKMFLYLNFINTKGISAPKYCRNVTLLCLFANVNAQARKNSLF